MTKAEHLRLVSWRSKILQHAAAESRTVAQTCRHFGISRKTYYKWQRRFRSLGDAGLSDRSRAAQAEMNGSSMSKQTDDPDNPELGADFFARAQHGLDRVPSPMRN